MRSVLSPELCAVRRRCRHDPSAHLTVEGPEAWWSDISLLQRQCLYGVGLPGTDDPKAAPTTHVCVGCCEVKWLVEGKSSSAVLKMVVGLLS